MTFQGTDWDSLATSFGYKSAYHMFYDLYIVNSLPFSQIAKKLGYSQAGIYRVITNLGLPKRKRGGANNAPKHRKALHMLDQRLVFNKTTTELAKLLSCHPSTVWKYKSGKTPIGEDIQ